MGIFDIFRPKIDDERDNRNNHTFTDEEREQSRQIRRLNTERRQILQQIELEKAKADLRELKEELYDYDDETEPNTNPNNPEGLLYGLLTQAVLKGSNLSVNPAPTTAEQPKGFTIPQAYIDQLKGMSKKDALKFLEKNYETLIASLP